GNGKALTSTRMPFRFGLGPQLSLRSLSKVTGMRSRLHAGRVPARTSLALLAVPFLFGAGIAFGQRPIVTPPPNPASAVGRPFNFTPITRNMAQDGMPTATTMFRDGDHYVRINVPNGWKVGGSTNEIHFDTPTIPGALITIRSSSLAPPEKFDDA